MQAALLRPREKKSVKSPVEKWSKYSPKQESATVYECRPTLEIIQRRTMLHFKGIFQHWNQTFWQVLAFENTPYSDPNLDGWATVNVCWHLINYVNACDLLQIVFRLDQEWWSGFFSCYTDWPHLHLLHLPLPS